MKADTRIGSAYFHLENQSDILDMVCDWDLRKLFEMRIPEPDFVGMCCGHDTATRAFGISLLIHEKGIERLGFIHVADPLLGGELGAIRDFLLGLRMPAEEVLMILKCYEGDYPSLPIFFNTPQK